jgi:hypothetical protein
MPWYLMWVLYITCVNIASFVSSRLVLKPRGRAHQPAATWEDQGDWPGPCLPGNGTEDGYHVSGGTLLRESCVLRGKSTVPSESMAVSAVHGAGPALLG